MLPLSALSLFLSLSSPTAAVRVRCFVSQHVVVVVVAVGTTLAALATCEKTMEDHRDSLEYTRQGQVKMELESPMSGLKSSAENSRPK